MLTSTDWKLVLGLYNTFVPCSGSKTVITKVFLLAFNGFRTLSFTKCLYLSIFVNDCCKPVTLLDPWGRSGEDCPLEKWVLSTLKSHTKPGTQKWSCSPTVIVITAGSSPHTFQGWSVWLLRQDMFITVVWNLCYISRAQVLDCHSTVKKDVLLQSLLFFFPHSHQED